MSKLFYAFIIFLAFVTTAYANNPKFTVLPNINTQYLVKTDSPRAALIISKSMEVVKNTLNINEASPYKAIRISLLYSQNYQVEALIVYLLSDKFKSFDLVRINIDPNFSVISIEKNYHLKSADLMQNPAYAIKLKPKCPDDTVQFVIGNNFEDDVSVENEVQKVYQMAKDHGYNPFLMTVNDPNGPKPTINAYLNWMSCPNVKGFYNESHGWEQGILLSDGDFTYRLINKNLVNKLNGKVALLDSCLTFHDPLLNSVMSKGNVQQYVAGIISLPFGASERTASCFWEAAFAGNDLNSDMLNDCSIKNSLKKDAFGIGGNGDNHLVSAAS